jgi:hypothetical protein
MSQESGHRISYGCENKETSRAYIISEKEKNM